MKKDIRQSISKPMWFTILVIIALGWYFFFANPWEESSDNSVATPGQQQAIQSPSSTAAHPTGQVLADETSARQAFDYYVLALSWSPNYCYTHENQDSQQCVIGKKLGFVLHGLWPEYEKGYPESCSYEGLDKDIESQFAGLYPSDSLMTHEWEKHGTCSGLTPREYLSLTKGLLDSLSIPDAYQEPGQSFRRSANQLMSDFQSVNADLLPSGMTVNCSGSGKYLSEVYICYSTAGQPTPCGKDVLQQGAKSCNRSDFLVRNTQ